MVSHKKLLKIREKYFDAENKAYASRDKKLVSQISKLERDLEKLEIKANKTMDPKLVKEMKKTRNEFFDYHITSQWQNAY